MKKKFLIAIGLCIFAINIIASPIKLESKVLSMADGKFFIADTIEMLRMFQGRVIKLFGIPDAEGNSTGNYSFRGKLYGTRELAHLEVELNLQQDKELQRILTQVKSDFLAISKEFESAVRGSKNIMTVLIEESCEKRERLDSLLLEWSQSEGDTEDAIFNNRVTTFQAFDQFCVDLLNFFSDLIHSCPKAQAQFKERLAKWKKFKAVLDALKAQIKLANEQEFLKHFKANHLDKLALNDITENKVKELIATF
jgi:hypothetical protein